MARGEETLSRRLAEASSLARSVASGLGLCGRIRNVQSMLCALRAERPGVVRVLGAVGVRVRAPTPGSGD